MKKMNIVDIPNPERVKRPPNNSVSLFSNENYLQNNFRIQKVELRQYVEKIDEKRGSFSLITSFVETDRGSIEMKYDEGFLGENPLDKANEFLISNLGISGLISRSLIPLESALEKS